MGPGKQGVAAYTFLQRWQGIATPRRTAMHQNSQKSLSNSELLTQLKPTLALDLMDENQSQIDSAETLVTLAVKPADNAAWLAL